MEIKKNIYEKKESRYLEYLKKEGIIKEEPYKTLNYFLKKIKENGRNTL